MRRQPLHTILHFTAVIVLSGISISCSPKIYSSAAAAHPPTASPDSVRIYDVTDSVPARGEILGELTITGDGMTGTYSRKRIFKMARTETAKIGGNALALYHYERARIFGCSSPQIWGTILHVSDSAPAYARPDLYAVAYTERQTRLRIEQEQQIERGRPPRHTLSFNIGAAGLIGGFVPVPETGWSGKGGYTYSFEYHWASRSGFGISLRYYGFRSDWTDFPEGTTDIAQYHFIGPGVSVRSKLGEKWLYSISMNIGYAHYLEKIDEIGKVSYPGMGLEIAPLGVEYMFSERWGLGLNAACFMMVFRQQNLSPGASFGLRINAGLRIYFDPRN